MYLYRTTFFWGILDDRNTWVAANFKTILQGKKKETNIPIVAWDFLKVWFRNYLYVIPFQNFLQLTKCLISIPLCPSN